MRILVTGGAGFIGSHVVEAYVEAGHTVAVLDNLSSGKRENLQKGVTLFEGNIQDKAFVSQTLKEFQPDVINHHAAQISVTVSVRDSFADAESNVLGTNAILMAMIEHVPKAKLIYASSGGAMYGKLDELPYTESSTPFAASPYGLSKYVAEQYIWLYSRLHGLKATVLRYSNVYGPRQDPHGEAGVCAIFADRMLAGEPVTIFGEGTPTRDYVFVKDVAAANLAALEKGEGNSYNIGSGIETSTQRLFEAFVKNFDYTLSPQYAPLRPGEVTRSLLSNEKAVKELQWKPRFDVMTGVAETAAWYRKGQQKAFTAKEEEMHE